MSVRFGFAVANSVLDVPVALADARDHFSEFGVDVDIVTFEGGGVAQQALARGEIDMLNYTGAGVAQHIGEGVEQRIVAAQQVVPYGWCLLVRDESPHRTIEDLDGARVAVSSRDAATDIHARGAAARAGVDVETVPVGGGELLTSLQNGDVAASSVYPPLRFIAEGEGWARSAFDYERLGETLPSVRVVRQTCLDEDPDEVRAVSAAITDSISFIADHRSETLDFLAETTTYDEAVREAIYDLLVTGTDETVTRDAVENACRLAEAAGVRGLPPVDSIVSDRFGSS